MGSINIIMGIETYIVFLAFIIVCSYYSFKQGAHTGRSEMVEDLIDRKLITMDKLKKEYEL